MSAAADVAGAFSSDAAAQGREADELARTVGDGRGRSCASCYGSTTITLPKGLRQQPVETTVYVVLDQQGRSIGRSFTSYTAAANLAQRIGGSVVQAGES